jgi:hypothetical protein
MQAFIKITKLFEPKYRIVTVTIVTIYDSVLWRLKAVTMRLVLENFKNQKSGFSYLFLRLFVTASNI